MHCIRILTRRVKLGKSCAFRGYQEAEKMKRYFFLSIYTLIFLNMQKYVLTQTLVGKPGMFISMSKPLTQVCLKLMNQILRFF